MPSYAFIQGGVCTAEAHYSEALLELPPGAMEVDPIAGPYFGRSWDGVTWGPEPEPAGAILRVVSVLAFRRRFTKAERIAIEWTAVDRSDQPEAQRQQAAALRAMLADQAAASFIDLDDADTMDGVQSLETMGLIGAGRAAEILGAPVQPEELP